MTEFLNSNYLVLAIIIFPLAITFWIKRKLFLRVIFPSTIFTTFSIQVVKKITAINRPFIENPSILGVSTNVPYDYSFPSLHTALATILAWTLAAIKPTLSWLGFGVLFLIALSRLVFGLHYFEDLIGGFAIATIIFWSLFFLSKKNIFNSFSKNVNLRRKIVHLFYGFILVFLIDFNILNKERFLIIVLGWTILLVASMVWLPRPVSKIVLYFERDKSPRVLAYGPFLFTISSFISFLVFPKPIAIASIINLAVGDSINALVGYHFKKNGKRTEASVAAIFASALISLQYVSPLKAVAGAVTTGFIEFTEPKIGKRKINDNALIPLLSGLAMKLVKG
jgi:undecaprenyl-diphosphatase